MHFIGGQPGGGTDGIVVSKFHVWPTGIPLILPLVDDHSEHLSHGMIHALEATGVVRRIGTCQNFAGAEDLVNSVRQLGVELEAVVGDKTNGASPEWDVLVEYNFNRALGCEFGCRNGVHACATAETVGENENVGIPLGSDRERADVIHANRDAKAGRKGQRSMGQRGVCL